MQVWPFLTFHLLSTLNLEKFKTNEIYSYSPSNWNNFNGRWAVSAVRTDELYECGSKGCQELRGIKKWLSRTTHRPSVHQITRVIKCLLVVTRNWTVSICTSTLRTTRSWGRSDSDLCSRSRLQAHIFSNTKVIFWFMHRSSCSSNCKCRLWLTGWHRNCCAVFRTDESVAPNVPIFSATDFSFLFLIKSQRH